MEKMCVRLNSDLAIEYHEGIINSETANRYPHTHDFCELYFFIEGNCSYMVENKILKLHPGTTVFTRPGELHLVRIDKTCNYSRFFYQFRENALNFETNTHLRCFFDRPYGKQNSLIMPISVAEECISRVKTDLKMYKANSPDFYSNAAANFLIHLSKVNELFDQLRDSDSTDRENPLISNALLYINEHIADLDSTDDIAKALFVSREYLSRSFSKEMGMTLNRYILEKKIANAKSLLSAGYSATEAAIRSGFNNYSYFIQIFRRETGHTPREWKNLDECKVTQLI